MLKLPTECRFAHIELEVISPFVLLFHSYLRSVLFHRFCSKLFHITSLARFHWVSEHRELPCGNVGRGGNTNLGPPPKSLYALTSFSGSRNTSLLRSRLWGCHATLPRKFERCVICRKTAAEETTETLLPKQHYIFRKITILTLVNILFLCATAYINKNTVILEL